MKITKLDYAETGVFSKTVTDYLSQNNNLRQFYNHFPSIESFGKQMQEKEFSSEQRQILHQALKQQYSSLQTLSPKVQQNLDLLKEPNTYTVTTGHQLNIFTGPLYFIYKIITAINTCKQLKEAYPESNFVPVYWMATEDHDFPEINHFSLFGKKYTWESDQTGAVGRFSTKGLEKILEELPENYPLFEDAYLNSSNLADATRSITHTLFGAYGLISVDGDDKVLKKEFIPAIEKELTEQVSNKFVEQSNTELEKLGYKPQVYSREINMFYLDADLRERIVLEGQEYKVNNTAISFTKEEILAQVREHPEKFSPNVILRPLYEEIVLPNLGYIGGGAEVAYWFQLKNMFEAFNVAFPIVMLRNSALYITRNNASKMHKLGLQPEELFKDYQDLKKQLSSQLHEDEINLEEQRNRVTAAFAEVEALAKEIDPTLVKAVGAEEQKAHNSLQMLEKKLSKARDSKYDQIFKQLENLKDKLFPNGVLQERQDNILTYRTNNPDFIPALFDSFDPFDQKFTILEEE